MFWQAIIAPKRNAKKHRAGSPPLVLRTRRGQAAARLCKFIPDEEPETLGDGRLELIDGSLELMLGSLELIWEFGVDINP